MTYAYITPLTAEVGLSCDSVIAGAFFHNLILNVQGYRFYGFPFRLTHLSAHVLIKVRSWFFPGKTIGKLSVKSDIYMVTVGMRKGNWAL
jgi:hypothetical protein